eukprot:3445595-Pleurochrysis_carterae.AAC.1
MVAALSRPRAALGAPKRAGGAGGGSGGDRHICPVCAGRGRAQVHYAGARDRPLPTPRAPPRG